MKDKDVLRTTVKGALASALVLALGATLIPSVSMAQDQEASDEDRLLEEVIVTARFREESLQETPIAITALSAQEIDIRGFTDSYQIGYTTPNTSFRPAQAAYGNTMTAFIRGIGQYDFDFAFEPGVAIYVDDVYNPFLIGSQIDLMDLERVEVLRGPQGTLFGRGSIGGAIRYVAKKPQGDNTGYVRLTVGDYGRVDVRAGYDFPITESLSARVSGVSKTRDGYQTVYDFVCLHPDQSGNLNPSTINQGNGCKRGTQGGEDVTGARGALRWAATDDLEFNLTIESMDDDSEARADTLIAVAPGTIGMYQANYLAPVLDIQYDSRFLPPNPFVSYATYDDPRSGLKFSPQSSFDKQTIYGSMDWALTDDMALKLIVSDMELDSYFATDADGSPLNIQTVNGIQTIETNTYELRLNGVMFDDNLEYTVGGFYYKGDAINQQQVSIPWLSLLLDMFLPNSIGPCILCGNLTFPEAAALLDSDPETYTFVNANNVHKSTNKSLFAHFVYQLGDRWSTNFGVRYSEDEKKVNFDNTRVQNPAVLVEDDHTDWRIGLDWQASDAIMMYGSVSTGYRPGAYNSRPFQASQVVAVNQEESTAYELGMKGDFLDHTLRLNVAAFYTDWETRILPVAGTECPLLDLGPPPVYLTVPPNSPGAVQDSLGQWCNTTVSRTFYANSPGEVTGFEAEFSWRPLDPLMISGQIGILDWSSPDIDNCDFNLDGVPDTGAVCTSDLPAQVPDQNWSLSASWDFEMGNGALLTPRVDVYGQSEICFGPATRNGCVDGYELVNASLIWVSPQADWTAQLGMTNLTDKFYWLNTFPLTDFGQPTAEGQPGRPQEWFLTVSRNFN